MPSFTPTTLLLAIGIIEILLGTAVLALPLPPGWRLPFITPAALTAYGTGFVFFGVIAFILHVTQASLPRLWRVGGNILIVLPLIASAWAAYNLGVVIGGTAYAILALVNVAAVLLDRPAGWRGRFSHDALVITVLLFEAVIGAALLAAPSTFRVPIYRDLLTYRIPIAGLLLAGAGALLAALFTARLPARVFAGLVAAGPLVIIPLAIIRAQGQWPGVFIYPILAAFLIAQPWLERALVAEGHGGEEEPFGAAVFLRTSEGLVWAVILLVTIAGNAQPALRDRLVIYGLVLVTSLFTLVWFRVPLPFRRRVLWGAALYEAAVGMVMHSTGGLGTPLFFLFFLPILATAWGLEPRDIGVPTAIGITAVAIQFGLGLRDGAGPNALAPVVLFRVAGLLLVAVFAYLLARQGSDQRTLLRREKEKLETAVGSLDEGLIVLDPEGRIQFCNRAASRLLNRPDEEAAGRLLLDFLTLQREDGLPWREGEHPITAALDRAQATRHRVLAGSVPDGTPRPFALTVTPFQEQDGRPVGVICSLRDVGTEVEMERIREDFFNIASHEIRTPLTVIKGHVELALDGTLGPLGDTARHVLTEIHTATSRLIRMVNDFLDAARVERGKISVVIDRGNLPALVEQAVATLAPDARRKGITLTYHLSDPAAVPLVLMDAEKALQVLINLIDNGVKFTSRGGVEIWHEVEEGMLLTYVQDTGAGIRPEERHRLFERFSQLERGLRRETGGSGLGLYISLKLAEHMNGTVYLKDSVPDAGSTFVFGLPVAPGASRPGTPVTRERTGTR